MKKALIPCSIFRDIIENAVSLPHIAMYASDCIRGNFDPILICKKYILAVKSSERHKCN